MSWFKELFCPKKEKQFPTSMTVSAVTPFDVAADFLLTLSQRTDEEQKSIIDMVVDQVMPGYHIHRNPPKRDKGQTEIA